MRVLVVDDSAFMRTTLTMLLRTQPDVDVRTARDGQEALKAIREYEPDVVTLDVNMPVMDGLTCLSHIMTETPRPVVMISSLTTNGAMGTLEALAMGAVDFVAKPGGTISLDMTAVRDEIVTKVRAAAQIRKLGPRPPTRPQRPAGKVATPALPRVAEGILVIGASTGGPGALEEVLTELPGHYPWPVVVAQHMPAGFTRALAERLGTLCALRVVECDGPINLEPGLVVIARGDDDMLVTRRGAQVRAVPAQADPGHLWHPSVDRLVRSAGECFPPSNVAGALLTGMGNDGAQAFAELRAKGAHVVAESESSCVVFGMPGALVGLGGASAILPSRSIGRHLADFTLSKKHHVRP